MKNNKVANKRNGFLDFLKLLFAFIIVIGHGDTIYGSVNPNKLIPLASFGVEFFFLVSGAMLLRSFEKQKQSKSISEDTFNFMIHKIKGLCPNYYVAWITLFIILSIGNNLTTIILNFFKAVPELLFLKMSGMPTLVFNGNTWYISAMLLALLIIYPIIRKNKDFFIKYIAPTITIFGVGYLTYNYQTVLVIDQWNGFMYAGLIRGIVEICMGCLAYEISKKIKDINLTKLGKIILTLIEVGLYAGIIVLLFSYSFRHALFVLLFVLMIALSITLSSNTYTKEIFSFKIFNWMGEYSYSLYLGHSIAYSKLIGQFIFNDKFTHSETLIIFFIASLICGLFIMYISKLVSYIWKKSKNSITNLLIIENKNTN